MQASSTTRKAMHAAIAAALHEGTQGRLYHLTQSGDLHQSAAEAEALAEILVRDGRPGEAIAALEDGLRVVRELQDGAGELRFLREWVKIVLGGMTPGGLRRALHEIRQVRPRSRDVENLESLVLAAEESMGGEAEQTLAHLEAISFDDDALDEWRHALRVLVARKLPVDREEEILADVAARTERRDQRSGLHALASWRGRLLYRMGDYEEAARLHAEAAEHCRTVTGRLSAVLNAASALMEAFRFEGAEQLAREAKREASEWRVPAFEARADWILRCLAYRSEQEIRPDMELVHAVERLGIPSLRAQICLNEAAIAWRAGDADCARDLAACSAEEWSRVGLPFADLSRALALRCGSIPARDEVASLASRAAASPSPGIGAQVLGLLRGLDDNGTLDWDDSLRRLASRVPQDHWPRRREVLSIQESLRAGLQGPPA